MKKQNKIITLIIAVVLTITTCIPIFAINLDSTGLPTDIDERITTNITSGFYYVKINFNNFDFNANQVYAGTIISIRDNSITYNIYNNYIMLFTTSDSTYLRCIPLTTSSGGNGQYNVYTRSNSGIIYVCIAVAGFSYEATFTDNIAFELYTINNLQYYNEGYAEGYTLGYNNGFYEGQNIQNYTNITGYVKQLLTQFVGTDAAPYITPIAIVLVILFVYFLFIRFLLSLIKAKGVIKTCDIVMVIASILLLIVMYAPMLNITINKNIRTDTLETTESTVVRRTDYIYDEYGRIISGPAGTIVYEEIESTTSEQEQTEVEVTTQSLEKEITTYEETKDNNIRN